MHTKSFSIIVISILIALTVPGVAAARGLFGPPQPISRAAGGLHTAVGYWYQNDKYIDGTEHKTRQNQIYSQVGYGAQNRWELYARVGASDLKIFEAFRSTSASTTTYKDDFEENLDFFGTMGAKCYYLFNKTFGIGAFIQGTYYFRDFTDAVSGNQNGQPIIMEIRVKNFWDVNFGIGVQALVPYGIKLYVGPFMTYSEATVLPSANIPGLAFAGDVTIKNKTNTGGFTGLEIPLGKVFRLNVEGQYSERLSAGAAVTYTY